MPEFFRYKPFRGRLVPMITIGLKMGAVWHPVLEAIGTFGFSSGTAVRQLKAHPTCVKQLVHDTAATEKIPAFHVTGEPITLAHLQTAQSLSVTHGLLTNASLTAAMMQTLALTDLASNDPDLSVVPGLTLWQPQP